MLALLPDVTRLHSRAGQLKRDALRGEELDQPSRYSPTVPVILEENSGSAAPSVWATSNTYAERKPTRTGLWVTVGSVVERGTLRYEHHRDP